MFFRMCNSLATFQAMIDKIFKKEIEGDLIIVYMDDVLGFSKTLDGLKKIEQIVLEKAREHDLFFKAKKCEFWKQKIEYLGLWYKRENWQWTWLNSKEFWNGLHQKKYNPF